MDNKEIEIDAKMIEYLLIDLFYMKKNNMKNIKTKHHLNLILKHINNEKLFFNSICSCKNSRFTVLDN